MSRMPALSEIPPPLPPSGLRRRRRRPRRRGAALEVVDTLTLRRRRLRFGLLFRAFTNWPVLDRFAFAMLPSRGLITVIS